MRDYPKKERSIFEGVLALAEGGADLHLITVQDIARAAGIGKGTVYEYFTSKEDILAGTILYCIEEELDGIEEALQRETSYDGCLACLGRWLGEVLEQRLVRYLLIMDSLQRSTMQASERYCGQVHAQRGRMLQMARRLVALGRAEGRIRPDCTDDYCLYVQRAALSGLVLSCGSPLPGAGPEPGQQVRQALGCARQLLQRAFG